MIMYQVLRLNFKNDSTVNKETWNQIVPLYKKANSYLFDEKVIETDESIIISESIGAVDEDTAKSLVKDLVVFLKTLPSFVPVKVTFQHMTKESLIKFNPFDSQNKELHFRFYKVEDLDKFQ